MEDRKLSRDTDTKVPIDRDAKRDAIERVIINQKKARKRGFVSVANAATRRIIRMDQEGAAVFALHQGGHVV